MSGKRFFWIMMAECAVVYLAAIGMAFGNYALNLAANRGYGGAA